MIIPQGYPLYVVHRLETNEPVVDLVIGWQFGGDVAHEGTPTYPITADRGLLDPERVISYGVDPHTVNQDLLNSGGRLR